MRTMRPILTAFALLALPAIGAQAQDKPSTPDARATEPFETVNKEFLAATDAISPNTGGLG